MMTKDELLELRDILHDFKHSGDVVTQEFVEAHIACLIEEIETRVEQRLSRSRNRKASR